MRATVQIHDNEGDRVVADCPTLTEAHETFRRLGEVFDSVSAPEACLAIHDANGTIRASRTIRRRGGA